MPMDRVLCSGNRIVAMRALAVYALVTFEQTGRLIAGQNTACAQEAL